MNENPEYPKDLTSMLKTTTIRLRNRKRAESHSNKGTAALMKERQSCFKVHTCKQKLFYKDVDWCTSVVLAITIMFSFVNLVVMMYYCILQLGLALKGIFSPTPFYFFVFIYFFAVFFFFMLISYNPLAIVKLPILYCLCCMYLSYYVLQVSLFSLLFLFSFTFAFTKHLGRCFFYVYYLKKKKKISKLG